MSTLTFLYKLTDQGRKQLFTATGNMPEWKQTATYEMATITPEERETIISLAGLALKVDWTAGYPTPPEFDAEPTLNELVAALQNWRMFTDAQRAQEVEKELAKREAGVREHIKSRKSTLAPWCLLETSLRRDAERLMYDALINYDAARDVYDTLHPAFVAEQAELKANIEAAKARAEAKAEARRKQLEAEKYAWIEANGSAYLRRACLVENYNCQRMYVGERVALEAHGFVVDWDDTAQWKERSCPSAAALDALDAARALGIGGPKIVWLTSEPNSHYDDFEPCEAVIIRGYLDKYDLVNIL